MIDGLPNRAEHLAWCKARALKYVDADDTQNAFASMVSDLRKHADTRDHAGAELGMMLMLSGLSSAPRDMREWIEGFR